MTQRPTNDQWCLALGKLQATFDTLIALQGAHNIDRWKTGDGHIGVDWSSGPYAHEVIAEILEQLATPGIPTFIDHDEVTVERSNTGELNTLWIDDVRVRMRPIDPVGVDAANEELFRQLASKH